MSTTSPIYKSITKNAPIWFLCAVLASICAFSGSAFAQTPDEVVGVGFTRTATANPTGGELEYAIWYPSAVPSRTARVGPYEFESTLDAKVAAGRFGLVALSHGSGGTPLGHRNIAIALAQAGFIAVAPMHPGDNFRDSSDVGHRIVWDGRPQQISAVIDHMLADPKWSQHIDTTRIGAFGFSMGGYTVLALSGAKPDLRVLIRHCDVNSKVDPLCARAGGMSNAMRTVLEQEYQQPAVELADNRICAAVVADPLSAIFPTSAIENIHVRALMVFMPERENELAGHLHGANVAKVLESQNKVTVETKIVPGAQHYSFIAPFPESIASQLPAMFKNDPSFDAQDFHQQFESDVVAFFDQNLKNCTR